MYMQLSSLAKLAGDEGYFLSPDKKIEGGKIL
jgi:hypothetical protein